MSELHPDIDYDANAFRPYPGLMREVFAPLADNYQGPFGLQFPAKTLDDLQWSVVTERLAARCTGDEARLAAERLTPLAHSESVRRRLREVEEATRLISEDVAPPLRGIGTIGALVDHASRDGVLDGEQLLVVAKTAKAAARLRSYFGSREHLAPLLAQIADDIAVTPNVVQAIEHAFDEAGQLKDQASPDLGPLRRRVQNYHNRLRQRVEAYLKDRDFEQYLQDNFFTLREDRYVLPIRAGEKGNVPGIVHGTSGSGQTIYIEPSELVDLNNDLRIAQMEVEAEERRILAKLTGLVKRSAATLEANIDLLAYLDLTTAAGFLALDLEASRAELSRDGRVDLKNARHPVLVWSFRDEKSQREVVANDIAVGLPLDELPQEDHDEPTREHSGDIARALVISGPNTGGKTVSLKIIGLSALMTRCGLMICADAGSTIPLFDGIFTDIGDEQSIEKNLSTFSGHVTNINSFVERVGENSLVLLDELFAGTDPAQGAALAMALLEHLAELGATVAVTTHLDSLKTLALRSGRFVNASMGFDVSDLSPTYELSLGLPGSSYAIRIAKKLGLPEPILERAGKIASGLGEADIEKILRELDRQKERLDAEHRRARQIKADAKKLQSRLEKELVKVRKQEERIVRDETREVMARLGEARDVIRDKIRELQQAGAPATVTHESLEKLRAELDIIEGEIGSDTTEHARKSAAQARRPLRITELEPDAVVWVLTFKRSGKIIEVLPGRDKVVVQVGGVRATVGLADLFEADEEERENKPVARPRLTPTLEEKTARNPLGPQSDRNTLDLRGLRADEAIERLELSLDAVYHEGEPGLYVIHGHGTGALKRAVRQFLPSSRYVSNYRPGEQGEGGDGVTVVFVE